MVLCFRVSVISSSSSFSFFFFPFLKRGWGLVVEELVCEVYGDFCTVFGK